MQFIQILERILDYAAKWQKKNTGRFSKSSVFKAYSQSMRQDLNLRPPRPERGALPS